MKMLKNEVEFYAVDSSIMRKHGTAVATLVAIIMEMVYKKHDGDFTARLRAEELRERGGFSRSQLKRTIKTIQEKLMDVVTMEHKKTSVYYNVTVSETSLNEYIKAVNSMIVKDKMAHTEKNLKAIMEDFFTKLKQE